MTPEEIKNWQNTIRKDVIKVCTPSKKERFEFLMGLFVADGFFPEISNDTYEYAKGICKELDIDVNMANKYNPALCFPIVLYGDNGIVGTVFTTKDAVKFIKNNNK